MKTVKEQLEAQKALLQVIRAVQEAVAAAGPGGVPAGVVYAALMTQGCTLHAYEEIEALMIRVGALRKKGDLLFATVLTKGPTP